MSTTVTRIDRTAVRTSAWCRAHDPLRLAVIALAVSLGAYLVVRWLTHPSSIDLSVYRVEGQALRTGLDLYGPLPSPDGLPATYPPFAAMLFVPLSFVPVAVMQAVVLALNIALLVVVAGLSGRLAGIDPQRGATVACAVAAVALWSEPVFTTLRYGQINLLLLAFVLWDFTRPATSRSRGIGIGLAAGLKVTPAIFIVYLLVTRRFRAALIATATMSATIAASAVVVPHAVWQYWTQLVFQAGRVGRPENAANQTLRGLMVRLAHSRVGTVGELLIVAAVLALGLGCAVAAHHRLGDRWGLPACAITSLLIAPVAWTHHWVWCVPIAVLIAHEKRQWLPALAVFWTFAVWAVPHGHVGLAYSPLEISLSAWYVVFGIGFLGLTAVHLWRSGPG